MCRGPYGHPWLERIDDDEEPIDGDRSQRQRRSVHAGTLGIWNYVAEYLTKHPMACKMMKKNTKVIIYIILYGKTILVQYQTPRVVYGMVYIINNSNVP